MASDAKTKTHVPGGIVRVKEQTTISKEAKRDRYREAEIERQITREKEGESKRERESCIHTHIGVTPAGVGEV